VEELEAGLTAVAAPVRNAEGRVVASISASGPSFRIPADRITELAGSVSQAAAEVSRRLGWAATARSHFCAEDSGLTEEKGSNTAPKFP
jgi:hypothetical protein